MYLYAITNWIILKHSTACTLTCELTDEFKERLHKENQRVQTWNLTGKSITVNILFFLLWLFCYRKRTSIWTLCNGTNRFDVYCDGLPNFGKVHVFAGSFFIMCTNLTTDEERQQFIHTEVGVFVWQTLKGKMRWAD